MDGPPLIELNTPPRYLGSHPATKRAHGPTHGPLKGKGRPLQGRPST